MAGRRRTVGKPLRRVVRHERRAANLAAALAAAESPADRVSVAADYLRAALTLHPNDREADRIVDELVASANGLYRTRGGARR